MEHGRTTSDLSPLMRHFLKMQGINERLRRHTAATHRQILWQPLGNLDRERKQVCYFRCAAPLWESAKRMQRETQQATEALREHARRDLVASQRARRYWTGKKQVIDKKLTLLNSHHSPAMKRRAVQLRKLMQHALQRCSESAAALADSSMTGKRKNVTGTSTTSSTLLTNVATSASLLSATEPAVQDKSSVREMIELLQGTIMTVMGELYNIPERHREELEQLCIACGTRLRALRRSNPTVIEQIRLEEQEKKSRSICKVGSDVDVPPSPSSSPMKARTAAVPFSSSNKGFPVGTVHYQHKFGETMELTDEELTTLDEVLQVLEEQQAEAKRKAKLGIPPPAQQEQQQDSQRVPRSQAMMEQQEAEEEQRALLEKKISRLISLKAMDEIDDPLEEEALKCGFQYRQRSGKATYIQQRNHREQHDEEGGKEEVLCASPPGFQTPDLLELSKGVEEEEQFDNTMDSRFNSSRRAQAMAAFVEVCPDEDNNNNDFTGTGGLSTTERAEFMSTLPSSEWNDMIGSAALQLPQIPARCGTAESSSTHFLTPSPPRTSESKRTTLQSRNSTSRYRLPISSRVISSLSHRTSQSRSPGGGAATSRASHGRASQLHAQLDSPATARATL